MPRSPCRRRWLNQSTYPRGRAPRPPVPPGAAVADQLDLAESFSGLDKIELIRHRGPWGDWRTWSTPPGVRRLVQPPPSARRAGDDPARQVRGGLLSSGIASETGEFPIVRVSTAPGAVHGRGGGGTAASVSSKQDLRYLPKGSGSVDCFTSLM